MPFLCSDVDLLFIPCCTLIRKPPAPHCEAGTKDAVLNLCHVAAGRNLTLSVGTTTVSKQLFPNSSESVWASFSPSLLRLGSGRESTGGTHLNNVDVKAFAMYDRLLDVAELAHLRFLMDDPPPRVPASCYGTSAS